MSGPLFLHTWRAHRVRLLLVSLALVDLGIRPPVVYGSYGSQFNALMESGIFPQEFARFGGGDIFSLPGAIASSFIHPDRDHL